VTVVLAASRRYLPRGWSDFGLQLAIWFGFLAAYQLARGLADRSTTAAFANGLRVIDFERSAAGLYELTLQRLVHSSHLLELAASWTYWLSEFAGVGLALLWLYFRRHDSFRRFRNAILLANLIGLVGYVVLPTAPPRMFPGAGFVDTLAASGTVNHGSSFVELASNQYAAMPSVHAADALIVGAVLAVLSRRWWSRALFALWPAWVWFCVMATGNHFWLDVVAGIAVATVAMTIVYRRPVLGRSTA
jgi:hypothetical protein